MTRLACTYLVLFIFAYISAECFSCKQAALVMLLHQVFPISWHYRLVSLLCFTIALQPYSLSLRLSVDNVLDKHLSMEENGFSVFLSLRDFYP